MIFVKQFKKMVTSPPPLFMKSSLFVNNFATKPEAPQIQTNVYKSEDFMETGGFYRPKVDAIQVLKKILLKSEIPKFRDHMTFRIRQCLKDNPQDLLFLSI